MSLSKSLVVLGLGIFASADLPIHCIHKDVVGTWLFEYSANDHDNTESCGYNHPDNNGDHFNGNYKYKFKKAGEFKVVLGPKNTVMDASGHRATGNWTMVYDEGFELNRAGAKYFAFFHYDVMPGRSTKSDEVSDYISFCDKTRVGWFHSPGNRGYGCYRALQTHDRDGRPVIRNSDHMDLAAKRSKRLKLRHDNIVSRFPTHQEENRFFQQSYSFIEAVNSDSSMHWTAKAHHQFTGKSHKHMRSLIGHRTYTRQLKHGDGHGVDRHTGRLRSMPAAAPHNDNDAEVMKTLPANFDWRNVNGSNYVTPVVNQGSCGSCYAISSMAGFESRLRIANGADKEIFLSAQDVLSCSAYNQGCEGGYPFLVAKYGEEFGFVAETSLPYDGTDDVRCESEKAGAARFKSTNYHYVGGFYGACNEARMMQEIYDKGPVVVAFQAPSELFYYEGGIFTGARPKTEVEPSEDRVNDWEQTNHAVLAVGWGYDKAKDMKYWIIKNEWGDMWGEGGYFRIRKGTDECGIESMAVAMDVTPLPSNM
mmetsp:Transcript_16928/g.33080  ORF Transcript_16928/g.33080 Transcript_16928/m.33080 type:complete len:535 (+) Transcript_16928:40-1644(+)|eukprot:CAMPEP_0175139444 /NCGR_PEP_ID=MMETSP0087-20121206/10906_1 /TAXON_ID=136419 /ORGANISM="Unknown Unknown, Strain D1" /LENGTH=534 /DNA_ID=CAMNT_0016422455 /DNA_START=39 /DNA_END=1643 /DNA_ORIENTATION=+